MYGLTMLGCLTVLGMEQKATFKVEVREEHYEIKPCMNILAP